MAHLLWVWGPARSYARLLVWPPALPMSTACHNEVDEARVWRLEDLPKTHAVVLAVAGTLLFARTGEFWTFLGFPTYGGGPFGAVGLQTSVPLLVAFVLVCLAEVAVGVMLLFDVPGAEAGSYLLLPFEFVFWIGFALPFGPLLGIARSILLLLA